MPDTPALTPLWPADAAGLDRAVAVLRSGGTLAFATETVYGLGADARDAAAVAAIFEAKARPGFNPLIVHVADALAAQDLVHWSPQAEALAQAFWPGPLTMVLPLRADAGIARRVTAGLDTLAVRVPAHPVAQALLRAFGGPVAAPSANRSGQISPTRSAHVLAGLTGRIGAVLEGGACAVGLESTILAPGSPARLLRPGTITAAQIEPITGLLAGARSGVITAPGQLASHYAPRAAIRLNATEWQTNEARLGFGPVPCDLNLSAAGDLAQAAANLFDHLHRLDATGAQVIAVTPVPDSGEGVAINDRLRRAAAPRES